MIDGASYVLDSSAILAVVLGEAPGRAVLDLLQRARQGRAKVALPFMALMETEYKLLRQFRPEEVRSSLATVKGWPAEVVESDEVWRHEAARIKAAGGLSLGDSWMASLAILSNAELVHKDPEFDNVPGIRSAKL